MAGTADWLKLAVAVEDIALRKLAEKHPDRPLKTNVEYYTAAVMHGNRPAARALSVDLRAGTERRLDRARARAGADNRLIRPAVRYIGEAERPLPTS